jgi:hypothetical protein
MSRYNRLKKPRSNAVSLRSLIMLFVATMSVSLLILIILFNLVFKNIALNFKTRVPESAPQPDVELDVDEGATEIDTKQTVSDGFRPAFEVDGVMTAQVMVPGRRRVITPKIEDAEELSDGSENDQLQPLTSSSKETKASGVPLPVIDLTEKPPALPAPTKPIPGLAGRQASPPPEEVLD